MAVDAERPGPGSLRAAPLDDDAMQAVRVGGMSALLAGIVFLVTIAYTFGFLFMRGLSMEMLNDPSQLLPWVHANAGSYTALWWIFVLHLLLLLPVPAALSVVVGGRRPLIGMGTTAGVTGAIVGMAAAMVTAATAPALGSASAVNATALLPIVWLFSELAGSLGLHLRLLSDLLIAVWLTTTGLALLQTPRLRGVARAQLFVSAFTVVVVVTKPFNWIDLEPTLGFALALLYLWMGIALLRVQRGSAAGPA